MSKIMELINAAQGRQNKTGGVEPDGVNTNTPEAIQAAAPKTLKMPGISNIIIFTLIIFLIAFQALSLLQVADRSSKLDKDIKNAVLMISDINSKGSNIEGSIKSALDEVALLKGEIKGMQEKAVDLDQKIGSTASSYKEITDSVEKIAKSSKANADYLMIIDKRIDKLAADMDQAQAAQAESIQKQNAEIQETRSEAE